jgi:hypothetical protein
MYNNLVHTSTVYLQGISISQLPTFGISKNNIQMFGRHWTLLIVFPFAFLQQLQTRTLMSDFSRNQTVSIITPSPSAMTLREYPPGRFLDSLSTFVNETMIETVCPCIQLLLMKQ